MFADSAPLPRELEGVLDALLAARVVLAETRGARRVVLNLEREVERVLGEVGGQQWPLLRSREWPGNTILGFLFYSPLFFFTVVCRYLGACETLMRRLRCYAWKGRKETKPKRLSTIS